MNLPHAALLIVALLAVRASAQETAPAPPHDYTSKAPRFHFGGTLAEQEDQLRNNPLLQQWREARRKAVAEDSFTPAYHFFSPNGVLNDPNGLCFWQGRWHLFYQSKPAEDGRWHWAHTVSDDLIHWRDLPWAMYPGPEEQCYSGATMVEEGRVIAMYHGRNLGQMVATAHDPLLLNFEKVTGGTVIPLVKDGKTYHFLSHETLPYRIYDPCIWKEGDVYYSLSGSVQYPTPEKPVPAEYLFRSKDLAHWEFVHQFLEGDHYTHVGDDGACPYFWPIGKKHILLFFSHTSSGQYLLGDFDKTKEQFFATGHGRFNFGPVLPGGVHAPSATPDGKGGVMAFFNVNSGVKSKPVTGIMTLPRHLTLTDDDRLGIEPAGNIESLRGEHQHLGATPLPANKEVKFTAVQGNALEIDAEIDAKTAPMVEMKVLCSPALAEYTSIVLRADRGVTSRFIPPQKKLAVVTLDNSHSSLLPDAMSRPPETAPVLIPEGEPFRLRVFVDHSIVEVFVNGRQCVALRVYPSRADSVGVSLTSQGEEAELKSLDAWQMKTVW